MTYSCKNAPRPTRETTYPGQAGWDYSTPGARIPIAVDIPFVGTIPCVVDTAYRDPVCAGCVHMPRGDL